MTAGLTFYVAAVFALDVSGRAGCQTPFGRLLAAFILCREASLTANHVSANSVVSLALAQGDVRRGKRDVNGLCRLTVHRVLYYGSN